MLSPNALTRHMTADKVLGTNDDDDDLRPRAGRCGPVPMDPPAVAPTFVRILTAAEVEMP